MPVVATIPAKPMLKGYADVVKAGTKAAAPVAPSKPAPKPTGNRRFAAPPNDSKRRQPQREATKPRFKPVVKKEEVHVQPGYEGWDSPPVHFGWRQTQLEGELEDEPPRTLAELVDKQKWDEPMLKDDLIPFYLKAMEAARDGVVLKLEDYAEEAVKRKKASELAVASGLGQPNPDSRYERVETWSYIIEKNRVADETDGWNVPIPKEEDGGAVREEPRTKYRSAQRSRW